MPQFIMNGIQEPDFQALDEFAQGYVQAIFFTETEIGTTAETHDPKTQSNLHGDMAFYDLAPEALETIIRDCTTFQKANESDIETVVGSTLHNGNKYDREQAGMDFWYTRNGHGVGYWDRATGQTPVEIADAFDRLTEAAQNNEIWVYMGDDGKLYF